MSVLALPRRLGRASAFALQAATLTTFFAAASAPTPLYGVYQHEWRFSSVTLTLIFAAYAVALLAALLVVGTLSDHLGRRPVLGAALVLEALAMGVFIEADGVGSLLLARIVQGIATGSAMGVLGAGLLELEHPQVPGRGALVNSVAPLIGLAAGGIGCSAIVRWVAAPTRTVYLVLLAALLIQLTGVLLSPETSARRPGALRSLLPRVGLPGSARVAIVIGTPVTIACWALGGLILSLGPAVARGVTGWTSPLLGGFLVLLLSGAGSVAVYALRGHSGPATMLLGTAGLSLGMIGLLAAMQYRLATVFLASTVIAGLGFGAAFSGVMRLVIPLVAPAERAELLASMYIISYLAFSVPAVLAGLAVGRFGLLPTTRGYAAVVLGLAVLAGLGLQLNQRQRRELRRHQDRCMSADFVRNHLPDSSTAADYACVSSPDNR
ncbi:MAG TPA: MFS transporter [Jatrophihabitans sp.]|nr:MFS transporter [Jatrophihabitans sp.]